MITISRTNKQFLCESDCRSWCRPIQIQYDALLCEVLLCALCGVQLCTLYVVWPISNFSYHCINGRTEILFYCSQFGNLRHLGLICQLSATKNLLIQSKMIFKRLQMIFRRIKTIFPPLLIRNCFLFYFPTIKKNGIDKYSRFQP